MNELLKKDNEFKWTEKQQKAFETLKRKLIEYPILGYPDYEKPFILFTDASGTELGAILSQLNEHGKEIVIAYASRSLTPAERNYPIMEQERLAIVWGIQYFHKYLIDLYYRKDKELKIYIIFAKYLYLFSYFSV